MCRTFPSTSLQSWYATFYCAKKERTTLKKKIYIYIKRQEKGQKEKDNNNEKEDREHLLDSTDLLNLHVHDCPWLPLSVRQPSAPWLPERLHNLLKLHVHDCPGLPLSVRQPSAP